MGFTDDGVPEQKSYRAADHQHHEGAQRASVVLRFKVEVKGRRHPAKQHKHFVQVADRNVPDVGADQIAFIPAHQRADERHDSSVALWLEPTLFGVLLANMPSQ